jgi:NADPH:quinone reductase-like Zn-dependent oxidoreductase
MCGPRALAGAGGVGTFAIQYAKSKGMWVAVTASKPKEGLVRSLGAQPCKASRTSAAIA